MNDELVRTQYVILNILHTRKATNHMKSLTLEEIAEDEKRSKTNTLYKHIRILQDKGLVEQGAKVERANGYILTKAGQELITNYKTMEEM